MIIRKTEREIEEMLAAPPADLVATIRRLAGDFMVLGVGGKMGITTALMLRRALDLVGRSTSRVYGVSRFSRTTARDALQNSGIEAIACDLADREQVAKLPVVKNVLFLAGQKFGTDDAPELTWVQNTYVPALVAQHFCGSRLVVFSTGCVYPFASVESAGSSESAPVAFLGEYASSCVGRERIFTHFARKLGTPALIFRLNYAVELRYGVIVDIAMKVANGQPVDVTTGWLNCIWQGDACARAIASLEHTSVPPKILNVTGPERLSVRELAETFGREFDRAPIIVGREESSAWLSDASESIRLFGPPTVPIESIIERVANHVREGGGVLGKPTHFEVRSGNF